LDAVTGCDRCDVRILMLLRNDGCDKCDVALGTDLNAATRWVR
jgi:hypothetical protein